MAVRIIREGLPVPLSINPATVNESGAGNTSLVTVTLGATTR